MADQLAESVRSRGNRTVADWLAGQAALCRGLLQDDAWSLEQALSLLDAVVAAHPGDVFALIDRADAWSARYPAARETEEAIDAALAGVTGHTLGAAAAEGKRLMENRRLVRARRAALSDAEGRSAAAPGTDPWREAEGAELGPAAAERVVATLAVRVAARRDDIDAALVLAEVLRGRAPRSVLAARYRNVERAACGGSGPPRPAHQGVCALSRLRLRQLAAHGGADGSIDHPA